MSSDALSGMRVVDIAADASGAFCARLLADAGADVVRLEDLAQNGRSRQAGSDGTLPSRHGPLRCRAEFAYLNQNKRSVAVDLSTDAGQGLWRRLIDRADVVVDSGDPGALVKGGLTPEDVRISSPDAVLVSITPFGKGGPYEGRPACHLTVSALGGWLKTLGDREREPVDVGFPLLEYVSGVVATVGAVAAWRAARKGLGGQIVDVSQQEVAMRMPLYPTLAARLARPTIRRTPFPMYVLASNGYAAVNALSAQHFRDACLYMGLIEEADDRELAGNDAARLAAAPRLQKVIDAWAADKTKEEIFSVGQAMRIPTGIPYSLLEVVEENNFRERGFFRELHTEGGVVQQPVGPLGPKAVRADWRDAPDLGENTGEVLEQWLGARRQGPGDGVGQ